ncbi:non-ribosomal peptide synthetase, partial [Thioclava sp. BHET1]
RTGDLAKRLPSGEIVVLGRKDAQVKLRGFRIELGEIETRLRAMPGVDKAAVDLRPRANGDKRLVAWLVAEAGVAPDLTAIAARLATELPDYMQPKAWAILPALPQTANGKLDRKVLPEPEGEATAPAPVIHALPDLAAPEGPLEAQLLRIWAEVLGTEAIGVTQSLHDLGADSLSVFRIAARMLSGGLDLEARDLLAHPTIRALAAHAKGRAASGAEPARRPALKDFRGGARRRAS